MCCINEKVTLTQTKRRGDLVRVEGRARIAKYRKGESEPYSVTPWTKNTIVGWAGFLDIIAGVDNITMGPNDTQIILKPGTGTEFSPEPIEIPVDSVHIVTPNKPSPSAAVVWRGKDVSTDEYTVNTVELWRIIGSDDDGGGGDDDEGGDDGDEMGVQNFSPMVSGDWQFNTLSVNWGTKTAAENWHFEIRLEIYGISEGDQYLQSEGLERMLEVLVGLQKPAFKASEIALGRGPDDLQYISATGETIVDHEDCKIGWLFVDPVGDADAIEWAITRVVYRREEEDEASIRLGPCRPGGPNNGSCGYKTSDDEWRYLYEIIFEQGFA